MIGSGVRVGDAVVAAALAPGGGIVAGMIEGSGVTSAAGGVARLSPTAAPIPMSTPSAMPRARAGSLIWPVSCNWLVAGAKKSRL